MSTTRSSTLAKHVDDCHTVSELAELADRTIRETAARVEAEFNANPPQPHVVDGPKAVYTPFMLSMLRRKQSEDAQVQALLDAGFTEQHMAQLNKPKTTPKPTRTDAEIEHWRAGREHSARIKARKAQRRADKLEAALNRDKEQVGEFDHGHLNIPMSKRKGMSLDNYIDHAASLHEARREAANHESRANYWANWMPKA